MNYRLESTDPATGECERMSLSASSDAQAVEQMDAVRWRHENAGRSRVLVLYRPETDGWAEVSRTGSRRCAQAWEPERQIAPSKFDRSPHGKRKSWIVVSSLTDGRVREDVLNACSAEGAASAAMSFGGVSDVVSVRLRDRP